MRRVSKFTTLYQQVQKEQYYVVDRHEEGQEDSSEEITNKVTDISPI